MLKASCGRHVTLHPAQSMLAASGVRSVSNCQAISNRQNDSRALQHGHHGNDAYAGHRADTHVPFANAQCYYGSQLAMGSLSGSIYINTSLSFLIELPAFVVCGLLIDRIGRRPLFMWSLLLGGAACASIPACSSLCAVCRKFGSSCRMSSMLHARDAYSVLMAPSSILGSRQFLALVQQRRRDCPSMLHAASVFITGTLVCRCIVCAATVGGLQRFFAMAGRFGTSAAFTVSYIYTAELFPTVVRSTAMGCTSVSARAGGIVAPVVVLLGAPLCSDLSLVRTLLASPCPPNACFPSKCATAAATPADHLCWQPLVGIYLARAVQPTTCQGCGALLSQISQLVRPSTRSFPSWSGQPLEPCLRCFCRPDRRPAVRVLPGVRDADGTGRHPGGGAA